MKTTNNWILSTVLLTTILLVMLIAYWSPMQSDDYTYFTLGLKLQDHLNHYNTWSGRFLADYISPLILLIPSKIIQSIIIASASVSMIFLISKIPTLIFNRSYSISSFIILFLLYWLSNPTLGQTIFWIVGAANYLFTNLIVAIYLYCFLIYIKKSDQTIPYILLLGISGLVGFSSENTTWVTCLFSAISSCYLIFKKKDFKILLSLLFVSCSFYFMIFSPGNIERANGQGFTDFYAMSFIERCLNFILYRMPTALVRMLPLIIPIAILFWIAYKNQLPKSERHIFYLLCLISMLSLGSMVMSPTLTYRSLSGPMLFLWIACAILLNYIFSIIHIQQRTLLYILAIVLSILFCTSYSLIAYSYYHLHLQENIIRNEINLAKTSSRSQVILPDLHYIPSLRARDSYDQFTNTDAMARYYGLFSVQLYPTTFDYSAIRSNPQPLSQPSSDFSHLYITTYGLLPFQGTNIVLSSPNTLNSSEELILKVTNKSNKIEIITIPLVTLQLSNQHILGVKSSFKLNEINTISYAIKPFGTSPKNFREIFIK